MAMRVTNAILGCATLLLLAPAAGGAANMPATPWTRAEVFATCSGRLAALGARQQADRDPASAATLRQRDMFNLMLDATMDAAMRYGVPPREDLRWRSAGWVETATLLADITYSGDAIRTARAEAALSARIADCTELLLGG